MAAAATIGLEDVPDDILDHILRRFDGPTLTTAGSTYSRLRRLSSNPAIWHELCLSTWPSLRLFPSLPSSPRSFFSRAFPFPSSSASASADDIAPPADLVISFVDLYHRGALILSRVLQTETETTWFRNSPFRLDALDHRDGGILLDQAFSPENLALSWLITDRTGRHVVDLSSRQPVAVDRHWFSGEIRVLFATVLGGGLAAAVTAVKCDGGVVKEVAMTMDDIDGVRMCGMDCVARIGEMMDGGRSGNGMQRGAEEAKVKFGEYVRRKRERKERRVRREGRLELCWIAAVVSAFWAIFALLFSFSR